MRCNECNVDLGESYTRCPLCGNVASADEARLEGLSTAEYPSDAPAKTPNAPKAEKSFSIEKLKAIFNL